MTVHRYALLTAAILITTAAFHLWYVASGALDLAPDEAHYWEWSRRLDWSYYSKGPLVAYLIAASTRIGGTTELFVRLPAVLLSVGTGVLLFLLTRTLFASARAGFLAVLACAANPLFSAGSMLMTIDAPLVFFWTLAAYAVRQAARRDLRTASRWWVVAGVALGLGVLSKYTMVLIVPVLGASLWMSPRSRVWLKTPAPYLALCLAGVLCTPLLVWNARHAWVSLRHVGALAGLATPQAHFTARTLFEFLGSQCALVSPVLFVAMLVALITAACRGLHERREEYGFVFLLAAPPLAFFLLWSVYEKVEGNWAAPAYVTATSALAALWDERLAVAPRAAARWIALALIPGFLMVVLAHFPSLPHTVGVRLPPRVDLTRRLDGWRELGTVVGTLLQQGNGELFLFSDHYQIASELAFYVPGQPRVYNINAGRRMNQYDIWGGLEGLRGHDGLFVSYGEWDAPAAVRDACDTLHRERIVTTAHLGQPGLIFSIFRCVQFKGIAGAPRTVTY